MVQNHQTAQHCRFLPHEGVTDRWTTWSCSFLSLLLPFLDILALVILFTLPPFNQIAYHFYSNYWPPGAAGKIISYASGIMHTGAIATGLRLNLFKALDKQDLSLADLASQLDCSERGLEILLRMLVSMDILQTSFFSGKYSLTRAARSYLVSKGATGTDLSSLFTLYWHPQLSPYILKMEDAVKSGGTQFSQNAATKDLPLWEAFAEVTPNLAYGAGKRLSQYLQGSGKKIDHVVDIACGSGGYGFAIAQQFPKTTVTFIDYENVIKKTQQNYTNFGFDSNARFHFLPGDIFQSNLSGPYDVVVAANIFQHFGIPDCIKLATRLYQATEPGGTLVILDFVITDSNPSLIQNPIVSELSLLMLLFSKEGQARSSSEWTSILTSAGWALKEIKSNYPFPYSYIVGTK